MSVPPPPQRLRTLAFLRASSIFLLAFSVLDLVQHRLIVAAALGSLALLARGCAWRVEKNSNVSHTSAAQVMMGFSVLALFVNAMWSGQAGSDALWYFIVIPVIAAHLLDQKRAVFWLIVVAVAMALVHASQFVVRLRPEYVESGFGLMVSQLGLAGLLLVLANRSRSAADLAVEEALARTETIRAQAEQLQIARDQALEATKAKSSFLAQMSHELRTPLNGVLGMAQVLSTTPLSEAQQSYVDVMRSSGESLLSLIGAVLDLSKAESGRLILEPRTSCIDTCIEGAIDAVSATSRTRGIQLTYELAPDLPELLRFDAARLRQVLVNLLGNAAKFTKAGAISLRVELLDAPKNKQCKLRFSVQDTGPGIAPELLSRVFDPFFVGEQTRNVEGSGLGLAISQAIVRRMGGELQVESTVGVGSTFFFEATFPIEHQQQQAAPSEWKDKFFVVLSAHEAIRRMVHAQLQREGLQSIALTPSDAVQSAAVYFVDPSANYSDEWRAAFSKGKLITLLTDQLSHPTGDTKLLTPCHRRTILQALSRVAPPEAKASNTANKVSTPVRVLLVEDNEINQKVAVAMLQSLGVTATVARDGLAAIEQVKANRYDLLLMDLNMPNMNGLDAASTIVGTTSKELRPVLVAMTAEAMEGTRERCLAAGFDDYIAKPVQRKTLSDLLQRFRGASEN